MSKRKKKQAPKNDRVFVSSEILLSFKDNFPGIDLSEVKWSWEVFNKIYEAEFEIDGVEYEAEFTVTGHLIVTEVSISIEELPKGIAEIVAEQYPDCKIEEVERLEYSHGETHYEIDLVKGEKEFEVHYREDGMFVAEGEDL
jgi:uncharacterized membrane protein YkoI